MAAAGAFGEPPSPPILAEGGGISIGDGEGENIPQDSIMDMHPMESVSDDSQPAHGSQVEMAEEVIVVRSPPHALPEMQSSGAEATTTASSLAELPLQPRQSPSQVRFSSGGWGFSAPEAFPRRAFHPHHAPQNSSTGLFGFTAPVIFTGEPAEVTSTTSEMNVDNNDISTASPSTTKRKRSSEREHTPRKKWSLHEDHHEVVVDDGNHSEDRTDSDESPSTAGGQKKRKLKVKKRAVAGGGIGGVGASSTEGVILAGDLDRLSIESEDNLQLPKHSVSTSSSVTIMNSSTSASIANDNNNNNNNKMAKSRKKTARFSDADPSSTEQVDYSSSPKLTKAKKPKARFQDSIDEGEEEHSTSPTPQSRPIKPLPARRRLRSPPPSAIPASVYEGDAPEESEGYIFNVDRTALSSKRAAAAAATNGTPTAAAASSTEPGEIDEDDDMEDLRQGNRGAFYFKPTAAERWERSQKRQQAIKDYRSRELTEARERRRRRRGSTPSSIGKAGGKGVGMARKRVQFAT